jgi:hypothetical protein
VGRSPTWRGANRSMSTISRRRCNTERWIDICGKALPKRTHAKTQRRAKISIGNCCAGCPQRAGLFVIAAKVNTWNNYDSPEGPSMNQRLIRAAGTELATRAFVKSERRSASSTRSCDEARWMRLFRRNHDRPHSVRSITKGAIITLPHHLTLPAGVVSVANLWRFHH